MENVVAEICVGRNPDLGADVVITIEEEPIPHEQSAIEVIDPENAEGPYSSHQSVENNQAGNSLLSSREELVILLDRSRDTVNRLVDQLLDTLLEVQNLREYMADMIYGELIAAASVTQSQLTGQRNHSAGAVQLNQMDGERNHSFMYLQNQYNGERSVFVMPNQINGESNAQQQQTNDPNGLSRISLPDVHRVDGLTADDMDVVALSLAARADVLNLDTVDEDYPDELDLQREDEEPAPDPILLERLMREEHFANSSKSNNGNAIISMSEASSVSELITSNGEGKASEACAP